MNLNKIKLMMADIIEENTVYDSIKFDGLYMESKYSNYSDLQVYPMSSLNTVLEECLAEDIIKRLDKGFFLEDEYFINGTKLRSLNEEEYEEFLEEHYSEIEELYELIDDEDCSTYNAIQIRESILKEHLVNQDYLEEDNVIFVEVSLFSIAEYLADVKVREIEENLSHRGPWKIVCFEDTFYLIEI